MPVISIRIDDDIYYRLRLRAAGANLSISKFLRPLIEDAAQPGGCYVYTAQDELLSIAMQSFAILAELANSQSPKVLERAITNGRELLRGRGLLGTAQENFIDVVRDADSSGECAR